MSSAADVIIDLERCTSCGTGAHDVSTAYGMTLCVQCQGELMGALGRLTRTRDPASWWYRFDGEKLTRTRTGDGVDSHTALFLLAARARQTTHRGR